MHIRRLASTLLLAVLALTLMACSGGKPESTVEDFYKAVAKGDADKAVGLVSFADVPANQMVTAKGKVQMMVGEMQRRIDANDGLKRVRIVDATSQGDTARVNVLLEFKNGKDQAESHRLAKEKGGWKIVIN